MNFNCNNIFSERVFTVSEPSSSQLGGAFIMDTENILLNNSGIYGVHNQGNAANKLNIPKGPLTLGVDISLKMKKSSPFRDGNIPTAPHQVIRKRRPRPEDTNTPVSQKKRRIDVALGLEAGTTVSNGLALTKRGPRITDLLPIQRDSWFYLPELWEYCGPDGRSIRERRLSPSQDGDQTITYKSDRLHQNGDRNNATAATVATWAELNRFRARYQELVAAFHGGPLVVHHLADRESEEKLAAIKQASVGMENAMAGVGRTVPPHPRLLWPTASPTTSQQVTRPILRMPPQTARPIFVAPLDTLLFVTPVEDVSAQTPISAPSLATLPASLAPLSSCEPPEEVAPPPAAAPPIIQQDAPMATPSSIPSSTKATRRSRKVIRIPQSITPPSVPLTSSDGLSFVSVTGQFRFTAAGEALFKLLAGQGKYDEAFAMLPAEQQFEHLTAPDAIAEFRSTHTRPNKGGEGKKDETELWVCKAKVRLEKRELPRANKSDNPQYKLEVVYSDAPCNGTATKHDSKVRHKKRTHLGRLYQCNATKKE